MNEQFNTLLSIAIIPEIINFIIEAEKISELDAISEFYNSETYELLSREESKVWHYSPMTIYVMWKGEKETGGIAFPEG